jgi:hypothetical protein
VSEQGQAFVEFIQRELEAERDRRKTLDARGAAVVTTAVSLSTLLAAVAAFITGRPGFRLPRDAVWPLTGTLIAFSAAAFCGIAVTGLRLYNVAKPAQMRQMLTERWTSSEATARNFAAELDVSTIESLRSGTNPKAGWLRRALSGGNNIKAGWLQAALVFLALGLVALTVTVYLIIRVAAK